VHAHVGGGGGGCLFSAGFLAASEIISPDEVSSRLSGEHNLALDEVGS